MLKPAFIDLSHWNVPSYEPLKAIGLVGVVHKLTESTSFTDDVAGSRFELARKIGLKWGLYHFIRPGNISAQVDFFLDSSIYASDEDTLFALDWEDPLVSPDDAYAFLRGVEQVTGYSPVLYTGGVAKELLAGEAHEGLSKYRLWLAHYAEIPELPPGWDKFWAWQYTDQGELEGSGIAPPIDLNAYEGTAEELEADWSGKGEHT